MAGLLQGMAQHTKSVPMLPSCDGQPKTSSIDRVSSTFYSSLWTDRIILLCLIRRNTPAHLRTGCQ